MITLAVIVAVVMGHLEHTLLTNQGDTKTLPGKDVRANLQHIYVGSGAPKLQVLKTTIRNKCVKRLVPVMLCV